MQPGIRTHFFLGADSRYGYCSLFGKVLPSEECAAKYIIKGGHASGKSAFLYKIAEAVQRAGLGAECYRSAALPEYLDGLYIPALKTVFLDGDTPHEISALYPGAVELYTDIGALYDAGGLRAQRDTIVRLVRGIAGERERLYRYLSAAGEIKDGIDGVVKTDKTVETIRKRVKGIAARELKGGNTGTGAASLRFLTAGEDYDYQSAEVLCSRICAIDNEFGLSGEMLAELRGAAVAQGHDAIVCLDPFEPDKIEHLLLPGLSLAFVSITDAHEPKSEIYKHIRLDALPRETLPRHVKAELKADRRLLRELLDKSAQARGEARRLYAELDAIYTARLELREVEELADNFAGALLEGGSHL